MDFFRTDDILLLTGWVVVVGIAYALLELNFRRPGKKD
jgi:hypothetical protein